MDEDKGVWRTISRIGVVVGIIVGLLTILGFLRLTASQGTSIGDTGQPTGTAAPIGTTEAATPTATSTATPTPHPLAAGTVLCQSGSNDNWNGWSLGSDWTVLNGLLVTTGASGKSEELSAIPPSACQPASHATRDYVVDATIQVVSRNNGATCCFGLAVRASPGQYGWTGYEGRLDIGYPFPTAYADIYRLDGGESLSETEFDVGSGWYTYAVTVNASTIAFSVNGGIVGQASDNAFLQPGEVGLWSESAQIQVSSFEVIAA